MNVLHMITNMKVKRVSSPVYKNGLISESFSENVPHHYPEVFNLIRKNSGKWFDTFLGGRMEPK